MSEREVYWRGLIDRQAQSGLSVAEFCQRQGVASPSFYVWRKRLRKQERDAGPCSPQNALFVPVALAAGQECQEQGAAVEIERADGTLVRVFEGAQRQTIADVLAALGAVS